MIPPKFEYYVPTSLGEATTLLTQHGDEAKVLSGGQSLIPLMKLRLAAPGVSLTSTASPVSRTSARRTAS